MDGLKALAVNNPKPSAPEGKDCGVAAASRTDLSLACPWAIELNAFEVNPA
jgi:hypothetical protein